MTATQPTRHNEGLHGPGLEKIRRDHGVPAYLNSRIVTPLGPGTITGSDGGRYIRFRLDSTGEEHYAHPAWEIRYLWSDKAPVQSGITINLPELPAEERAAILTYIQKLGHKPADIGPRIVINVDKSGATLHLSEMIRDLLGHRIWDVAEGRCVSWPYTRRIENLEQLPAPIRDRLPKPEGHQP